MSTRDDFLEKRDTLHDIPDSEVEAVKRMPMATYVQEAETLNRWCQADRAALETLDGIWELVQDLPTRAGALRELESMWRNERSTPTEAGQRWKNESPAVFGMRKGLIQAFRYAFRDNKPLLARLRAVAKGNTNAERLQNLNDLAVLGRDNEDLLTAINFDLTQLDEAAAKSAEMSELLATVVSLRKKPSETLKLRDKAYTHLKAAVDEIYCAGRYLLRRNSLRRSGYRSAYLDKRSNQTSNPTEPDTPHNLEPTTETTVEPGPPVKEPPDSPPKMEIYSGSAFTRYRMSSKAVQYGVQGSLPWRSPRRGPRSAAGGNGAVGEASGFR